MESTNSNNHMFVCELKELRKELSAMKTRIVQLEKSQEKQQERIDILERENYALKTKIELSINGNNAVRSTLKRKRTDEDKEKKIEAKSTSASASSGKKIKTNSNGDSFDSLNDDLLHKIVEFNGNCYSKFGSINKRCKNIYDVQEYKLKKQTCLYGYGTVDMILEHYLQKRREGLDHLKRLDIARAVVWYNRLDTIDWIIQLGDIQLLHYVCGGAAWYGRINILSRVFCKCNLTMLDQILNSLNLCYNAALNGQLELIKWLRKYGAEWSANTFIGARDRGYDEIVQYLRAEGCPETSED